MAAETSKIDPIVERRLSAIETRVAELAEQVAIETRVAELAEQVTQLAHILGKQDKLAKEIATIKYESREAEQY
jgi:hypothetical protein